MPDLDLMSWNDRLESSRAMADDIRQLLEDSGGQADYDDIIGAVGRKHRVAMSQVRYALVLLGSEIKIESRRQIIRIAINTPSTASAEDR